MTLDDVRFVLTIFAALGCGLIAGVFFAFSAFVMRALARLPSHEGLAAMKSINIAVINPVFMTVFLGSGAACVALAIASVLRWKSPGAAYVLVGSLVYVVGSVLVTMVFNVPRNNALAEIAPTDPDSAERWARYVAGWTAWNHVRTVASLAAAALLTVGVSR